MQTDELSPEELSTLLTSYMPEIPGYRVIRRIGRGGMSHVYLGVQVSLDRQVAIKVMSPEALTDEKSKARFEQEAHTIAKLEHPCIVGVHEVGRTPQGLLYYVLPYLARGHLGQRDFTQDEPRIVEVLRALLSALEYAHTRGIVHRDVKAENVLFDNADRPLLTDFGIALSRHDTSRITTAGLAVGSGGYMAPEQARGEAVDGRADLYSVGVLAFELLNGRLPYLSSDPLGLALMHAQDPIPRLPPERRHWQAFIDRAMAKSPDNRFRNAQQMLGALNQITIRDRAVAHVAEPVALAPPSLLHHPWTKPVVSALTGAGVLLLVLALLRGGPQGAATPAAAHGRAVATAPAGTQPSGAGAAAGPAGAVASPSTPPMAADAAPVAVDPAAALDLAEAEPTALPEPPAPADAAAAASNAAAGLGATTAATTVASTAAPTVASTAAPTGPQATAPMPIVAPTAPSPAGAPMSALSPLRFAGVRASATVTPLAYDPAAPGARALHAAQRQLGQTRLATPVGDNAIESVLAAKAAGAPAVQLDAAADAVIDVYARVLPAALKTRKDATLRSSYLRAQAFAKQTGRLQGKAWENLKSGMSAPMLARLQAAHAASDPAAVTATRALATALALDTRALEPTWSRPLPVVRPGKPVQGSAGGPATVLVQAPANGRPGLAFMRHEVSRAEYAAFASATNRGMARCRNRLAPISFKRRSWASPGFSQNAEHPAVCVSFEDARAYAQWLSARTGETWRLPSAAEWRQVANYRGSGSACQDGRVDCGQDGTIGAGLGPASPLGLTGVRGNAREWLSDCVGACSKHLVGGLGWRDNASRADPLRSSGFDARTGLDDTGFRLVRDVGAGH